MRKYLIFILIPVALMTLLNSVANAGTTDQTGTCTWSEIITDYGGVQRTETRSSPATVTEASCNAFVNASPSTRTKISWVANPTSPTTPSAPDNVYHLLAPIPCQDGTPGCIRDTNGNFVLKTFDPTQQNNLGVYLNIMINIIIGLAAVLSVVMIVMGGVEYMTSELSHSKEAGKEKIEHSILGLIIALGAYALLFTINPSLLQTEPVPAVVAAPRGTCQYMKGDGSGQVNQPNVTEEECNKLINDNSGYGGSGGTWLQYRGAGGTW